ncbi:MG2 domain-containing protein [Pseudomonas sp. IT-347P]|uniref:Ig-like domain-containing protein n=1 Tax=Pseudomonas sp. IT-347P TaxID=3026458 RepID=UPI0039E17A36
MPEPIIQAKQNLVLNGDFSNGTREWKKIGIYIGVDNLDFEEARIQALALAKESGVSQSFQIPLTPSNSARYSLTFLWETLHTRSGWLRIFKDQTLLHEYELRPTAPARPQQEPVQGGAAFDEFVPQFGRLELGTSFVAGDNLRLEIFSPQNDQGDNHSKIRITRIDLQVQLEPLQLQALNADWETFNPEPDQGFLLHLCLGASGSFAHQLRFVPSDGNAWADTAASLAVIDNPDGAVIVTPGPDENQSLTQTWTIDCPLIGGELYPLSLSLRNQYDADSYPIAVSLGHHRLAFIDTQGAEYYPVLGQSVRLGVQIGSYYTRQTLDGRTVNWAVNGQSVKSATVTNDQGWAWFDYQTDTVGDVVVEASVDSPYYQSGCTTELFELSVLASDPWDELVAIVDGVAQPWTSTGYPNRGSVHTVQIRLPAATVLKGSTLSLHWSGDPQGQLGVEVRPELGLPVPYEGEDLVWTLISADRLDGEFDLSLVCSKLQAPSPKRPMSLARNEVEIGDVREASNTAVVADWERVLVRLQVVHKTEDGTGEGVIDAIVEWETKDGPFTTHTGSGGWASLLYGPKYIGEQTVIASVRAHPGARPVTREFEVKSIENSAWKDKVEITFEGGWSSLPHRGMLCKRGESNILQVKALPDSPLIGKSLTLDWRKENPRIGLDISDIGTPKVLREEEPLFWTLSSDIRSTSSLFELKLTTDGFEDKELFGRLMLSDINDEVSMLLDQTTAMEWKLLYPCLGGRHRFILRPHALSPLVGIELSLQWYETGGGGSPEQLDITIDPPLNTGGQVLGDGGASWTLDCSRSLTPGSFGLRFLTSLGFTTGTALRLDHNKLSIAATRESPVYPVVGQEPAWMWAQVTSAITGAPVDGVPVQWIVDGQPHETPTADAGWSGYPFKPVTAGPQPIECRVRSPYDDHEDSRVMIVRALDNDPWDALTIEFDGASKRPWGRTLFPRHKGQYRINVAAGHNSPLYGHRLMLGMTATEPANLGIHFSGYALGAPRTFSSVGLDYYFTVGDETDGTFDLCLASERLASLSPANAMSVGPGESISTFAKRPRVNQTLPWGAEVKEDVTVVSATTGKPMSGITVTWRSPELGVASSVTNFHGVASIRFAPVMPGAFELTASLDNEQNPASIVLGYVLDDPRQISVLLIDEPSGYPGQEKTAQAWVVSARTGEPVADVEVMWEYDNASLPSTLTDADGKATVHFALGVSDSTSLWASVAGGIAGWHVRTLVLNVVESRYAAVQSVVGIPNPVRVHELVTMTAQIVDKQSGEPMPFRKILASHNNASFTEVHTDSSGKYSHTGRPMLAPQVMSLAVEVENPDGSTDAGSVQVKVVN